MHPDLPRLLDLQAKDQHLAGLLAQRKAVMVERAGLETALERHRNEIAAAKRSAEELKQRRDALSGKLDKQRSQQEKRKERLEQERNPRIVTQLMADFEMARGILAQEESDWLQLSDEEEGRGRLVHDAEVRLEQATAEQAPAREEFAQRLAAIEAEVTAAQGEREAAASQIEKNLRTRYDRLRSARKTVVVVPVEHGTCTGCFTAIPSSRVGPLQHDGVLIEGCQSCGAIIYLPSAVS